MAEWQPIETAPRNGEKVDLFFPYPWGRTVNCYWESGPTLGPGWGWRTPRWDMDTGKLLPEDRWCWNCYPNMEPSHWMPSTPDPECVQPETKTETDVEWR